ncbi:MAG: hypothetical protein J6Y95_03995, partial [Lachnospiraceae bacterium]|nr:hypothetical protein [Lachnospiraceae bacterium]
GLPRHKAMNEEFKREFGVRFTPEGNERKRLDIAVFLIPLKNYEEGQCGWCVWWPFKSKKAFIENHNRTWGTGLFSGPKLLDASALDLDD